MLKLWSEVNLSMSSKTRVLTDEQLNPFRRLGSTMVSLGTVFVPGGYPVELKNCGINERGTPRNQLLGYIITQPSGSQLAIETAFHDLSDGRDKGDLHIVNFQSKDITSHYRGWGTWVVHYGDKHWECKNYLRIGTETIV